MLVYDRDKVRKKAPPDGRPTSQEPVKCVSLMAPSIGERDLDTTASRANERAVTEVLIADYVGHSFDLSVVQQCGAVSKGCLKLPNG